MANPSLLILAGDGIGPEVMDQVKRIIGWFGEKRDLAFDVSEDLVGGAAYDAHGVPLPPCGPAGTGTVISLMLALC